MTHETGTPIDGTAGQPIRPIPHPPRLPLVGNLMQIPKSRMAQYFLEVSRDFDGIFEMDFAGVKIPFAYSADLVAELCDETRFRKVIRPPLSLLRDIVGDGLFTAKGDEPQWGKAHRILMPAFSQRAMKGYFDAMQEVAGQLCDHWQAHEGEDLLVADDMTRLTLDTISLSGFGFRFNSFDSRELHPFLGAMVRVLAANMAKLTRMPILERLRKDPPDYLADIDTMNGLVDEVIRQRRDNPTGTNDLLNLMLNAEDPETGERLDDLNIRQQVLTFLVAGHETTSGLLTFTLYFLLRNPHVLAQAYAEVDRVLPGDTVPDYRHLAKLDVIERVLKETLRLWPTAPAFLVAPYRDEVIGGRYRIPRNQGISVHLPSLHRDPNVWDNPEVFDIDRFLPENEARIHPHGYKPFGNGERACIGRQFALTEAKLAIAMILQRFALTDPHDYHLDIKETLTLKPDHFYLRVRRRKPHERLVSAIATDNINQRTEPEDSGVQGQGEAFTVAWGTSLGTARDIAEELASRAASLDFNTRCVPLDELAGNLPDSGILVVVTATYNGYAPDTAKAFEALLDDTGIDGEDRPDLRFAVLGCGNSQWVNYQAFPQRMDQALAATNAQRLLDRGAADGNGDFEGAVEDWLSDFWQTLGESAVASPAIRPPLQRVDSQAARTQVLPDQARPLTVMGNRELVTDAAELPDFTGRQPRTSTRQITMALPEGMTYQTGDHLAIYPTNQNALVRRACERLGVEPTELVHIDNEGAPAHLPAGATLSIDQLLSQFLELQEPASRRDLRVLAANSPCPHTRQELTALAEDSDRYHRELLEKRQSLLDLLESYPAIQLPVELFAALCPPLRPRFYSISSSALAHPNTVTLTVGTVQAPAWSGQGEYRGVASHYLRHLTDGDTLLAYVRQPSPTFTPPADPAQPMILIAAGTGIAPYRAFLEERAHQAASGQTVATNWLFYGCRHPDHDLLYGDELANWQQQGIATLFKACSGQADHPHQYVQDALWHAREQVWQQLEAGTPVYVCGDGSRMAPAVRDCMIRICEEQRGCTREAASQWLQSLMQEGRYHQDIFGTH